MRGMLINLTEIFERKIYMIKVTLTQITKSKKLNVVCYIFLQSRKTVYFVIENDITMRSRTDF